MTKRWTVRKRQNQWRIYDHNTWTDTFNTLYEAHTYATQNAIADQLYTPGGLTHLKHLLERDVQP